jgi:hypothetical protein
MRKLTTAVALALMLGAGLMAAPALYAQGEQAPSDQKSGQGMMREGMMGQGGMGGMMGMMRQMSRMMDRCNRMMDDRDGGRPNENWKDAPEKPENKG